MKVVIVGGGIGGLAAALELHDAGIECEIHERSATIRELGVGINLLPPAVTALDRLGLLQRLDAIGVRTRELRYAHRLGQEILRRPCGLDAGHAVPQLSIHRGRLQALLADAVRERLGQGALRTDRRLVGFEQDRDGVRARFVDAAGERLDDVLGDVLVGADGIHSTVRAALFPHEGPPLWSGVLMWRGAVDHEPFLDGRTMIISGGSRAKLVLYPIAPGATAHTRLTNWVVLVDTGAAGASPPRREDWTRPGQRGELLRHLGRFCSPHVDVVELVMATPQMFEYPMCDRDPLPHWTVGRVTLLGDAAHPMYPMGSNGAGQAILDAVALRECLCDGSDPAEALAAYAARRRPVTTEIVLRNRAGGPEQVIDEVERRAPEGFDRLADVIDPAELDAVVGSYTALTTTR